MFKVRVGVGDGVRGMELGDVVGLVRSGAYCEVYPCATSDQDVGGQVGLIFRDGVFQVCGVEECEVVWRGMGGEVCVELVERLRLSEELVCEVQCRGGG